MTDADDRCLRNRGHVPDPGSLAQQLAATLMRIEQVPELPMFRNNTAAFVHSLSNGSISNVEGDGDYVRVQVLMNAGALDRDKQLAVVAHFTAIVADAAGRPELKERTWVLPRRPRTAAGTLGPRSHQRRAVRTRRSREAERRRAAVELLSPTSRRSATGRALPPRTRINRRFAQQTCWLGARLPGHYRQTVCLMI